MDPINYNVNVKSPFESALIGSQTGLAISGNIEKQKELQQQRQLQEQMQSDLNAISNLPNPTADDYARVVTRYPQLADKFKAAWGMMDSEQQRVKMQQGMQVYSALQSGNVDLAKNLLQTQADAARNSGKTQDAQALETSKQILEQSPDQGAKAMTRMAGIYMAAVLPNKDFQTALATAQKLPSEIEKGEAEAKKTQEEAGKTRLETALMPYKTQAEISNINSQIGERSGRLNLDRDKLTSEVQLKLMELNQKMNPALSLDDGAKKLINDSAVNAVTSRQSAAQMTDLANRLESSGAGYGYGSTASEWFKAATGRQDEMTRMRQEYTRLRSSQVMKSLPPGPASDKDIQLAMKGFPPDNADAATMAAFLRGMAKMNNISAAADSAKSEWVNAVGHLGKPRADINIDGIAVPAGTSFPDFAANYVSKKGLQVGQQQQQQVISSRSYMSAVK